MPRIVALVSGGGTNLQSLIDAQAGNCLGGGEVVAVFASRAEVFALERAQKADIPAVAVPRRDYNTSGDFCRALEREIAPFNPDLIVCAGFLCVLDSDFCDKYAGKIINIHPSLIPSFCGKGMYGLHVHEAALSYGVKITGATVHFVNSVPDGGEIISQKAVDVLQGDSAETLQKRVMAQAEQVLLPEAVRRFCAGELKAVHRK